MSESSNSIAHYSEYNRYARCGGGMEDKATPLSDYIKEIYCGEKGQLEALNTMNHVSFKLIADLFYLLMKKGVISLDEIKVLLGENNTETLVEINEDWNRTKS